MRHHLCNVVLEEVLGQETSGQEVKPTHFNSGAATLTHIDRIYSPAPGWQLINARHAAAVVDEPMTLYAKGISDHSPVQAKLSSKGAAPRGTLPISHTVCNHHSFKTFHDKLASALDLDNMAVTERWETHKLVIQEAG